MSNLLERPIIFIGAPRSGTTITSEAVFQHKDLAWPSTFQEKYPTSSSINYLRRIYDNSFWRIIGHKNQLHGAPILSRFLFQPSECYRMWSYLSDTGLNFGRSFLLDTTISDEQKKIARLYFHKLVKNQGKKRLAIKITGPPRIGYLLSIFPDAVFVLIRRNYIPNLSSLLKVHFWKELGMHKLWWTGAYDEIEREWAEKNSMHPHLITAYQLRKIRSIEDLEIGKCSPKLLTVHYEDFVIDTRRCIGNILSHCNLDYDTQISRFLKNNSIVSCNRIDSEYFDDSTLSDINYVLKTTII